MRTTKSASSAVTTSRRMDRSSSAAARTSYTAQAVLPMSATSSWCDANGIVPESRSATAAVRSA
ncbi:MAG: hypothetical protein ACM3S1_05040 [Hyphomicrobiales bacterium]